VWVVFFSQATDSYSYQPFINHAGHRIQFKLSFSDKLIEIRSGTGRKYTVSS